MLNISKKIIKVLVTIILLIEVSSVFSQEQIIFTDLKNETKIGSYVGIYEDTSSSLTSKNVLEINDFKKSDVDVLNLNVSKSTFWIKFTTLNKTSFDKIVLHISNPLVDEITLFKIIESEVTEKQRIGRQHPVDVRKYNHQDFIFDLNIPSNTSSEFLIKVKSTKMIVLPITIGIPETIEDAIRTKDLIFGIFSGVMMVMLLYNLFIYFTVRDKSYLYYVVYILIVALMQLSFQGYTYKYIWPDSTWLTNHSFFVLSILVGVAAGEFIRHFLNIKKHSSILDKGFYFFYVLYALGLVLMLTKSYDISHKIIDIAALTISIYILFTAFKIMRKGSRSAIFLLISWSFFLIGVAVFAMKNFGVLPSNNFTEYTMPLGAAIETVLLSFALADKINIYKKEKEESQRKTVEALQENEKIIREQNIVLEQKVEERTTELNQTLVNLKETQSQLVDAEKMSSLGQLTAGIAHEINNPINFVSSNVAPLRQDIEDLNTIINKYQELETADNIPEKLKEIEVLKKELDFDYLKTELATIIDGIEDGAKRTTEIVSGLRNFARLDEGELKNANINEGIESTLILIKSKLNGIKIKKSLNNIPSIECNPGKINQMVMNLIDNAIYAIDKSENKNKDGLITVTTESNEDLITLTIKDNGIGIPDNIKDKLFDPFFTTKDVGEGTGLGLSIVRSIVDNHKGKVIVHSKINKGTEIIVEIPIKRDNDGKN